MNRNLHVVFLGLVVGVCASTSVSYGQGLHGKQANFRIVVKEALYVKGQSLTGARDGLVINSKTKSYETDPPKRWNDQDLRSQYFEWKRMLPITSSVNNWRSEAEVGNRSVRVKRNFSKNGLGNNALSPSDSIEDQVDSLGARTDGPIGDDLGVRNASAMARGEALIPTYYMQPGRIEVINPPLDNVRLRHFTTKVDGKIKISCAVRGDTMTDGEIWRKCGPSWYLATFNDDLKKWFIRYEIRVEAWNDVDDGEQDGWIKFEGWSDDHNLPAFEMTTVFICGDGHDVGLLYSRARLGLFGCEARTMYRVEPQAGNAPPGPLEAGNSIKVTNTLEVSGTLYDPPWDDRP